MTARSHDTMVTDQFGPRAAAYVASAVHAQGEDLEQLAAIVRGRKTARALDLGCGGGHVSFTAAPHVAEIVAYDLSDEMLAIVAAEAAKRGLGNVATRLGPAEHLPFPDASFDLVLSRYSAHHWNDFRAGLKEARRVLKKDGYAVFMDAISPGPPLLDTYLQTTELLRDPSHVRDYSCAEWQDALTAAGFAPGRVTPRRLRLEFTSWVTRTGTPEIHVQAIRSIDAKAAQEVRDHFSIEPDGSFMLDTMTIEATPV